MSRRLAIGLASALVVVLAVVGAGIAAGTTLLGPVGFVRVYLDALARGDAAGALGIPGVSAGGAGTELLAAPALGGLVVGELRELDAQDGVHRIEAAWEAGGTEGRSVFLVERVGTSGLLFPRWGFAVSPTAVLELEAVTDDRVRVNGAELLLPEPARLAVFVPGAYRVGHESRYLSSAAAELAAAEPGAVLSAVVEARPTERLRREAEDAAQRFLDDCAAQQVLFPTGCPFGRNVLNQVISTPVWSIAAYPELEFEPRGGGWRASGGGTAHLQLRVREIFDGSRRTLEEDIPFELRLDLRITPDDLLEIVPVGSVSVN